MLKKMVTEIEELHRRHAEIERTIQKKLDALVIQVVADCEDDAGLSERDVCTALAKAGYDLHARDAYPLLKRLADERKIQMRGIRYAGLRPEVMKRQLKETRKR
jgi:hypothetical protein